MARARRDELSCGTCRHLRKRRVSLCRCGYFCAVALDARGRGMMRVGRAKRSGACRHEYGPVVFCSECRNGVDCDTHIRCRLHGSVQPEYFCDDGER